MTKENKEALLKAAANAKINLTEHEASKLVGEIDEVLKVFSKIDEFKDYSEPRAPSPERKMRDDKVEKSALDPFSNSKLVRDRKFLGPKLVD